MQNNVINNIRLDLNKEMQRVSVSVRKNDTTTRRLDITLVDHGKVVSLENASIALLMAEKPDGRQLYNDCVINGDEIQYTLTTQTINVVGEVKCQVQVTYSDGSMLTSPIFLIAVYSPMVNDTVVESMNEYEAVSQFVVQAEQSALQSAASARDSATSAANSHISEILSESWATGGTGARDGEDNNNARYYAESASGAASEAAELRTEAAVSATSAEENAAAAAESQEAASTSARACAIFEQNTRGFANETANHAAETAVNAQNAAISEENAHDYEKLSESYAVGTDGEVRPGDDEDNAKYYKERAEEALSGNVIAAFEIDGEKLWYVKTMFEDATDNHFDFAIADSMNLEVSING